MNFFLKIHTKRYKRGVSNNATITLNKNPEITRTKNLSSGRIPKRISNDTIVNVSTNCDVKVEKLFLNQRCFPLVSFFQKWYILISINCANKYVNIDANTASGALRKTLLKVASSIGDASIAGTWLDMNIRITEKIEANIPVITT